MATITACNQYLSSDFHVMYSLTSVGGTDTEPIDCVCVKAAIAHVNHHSTVVIQRKLRHRDIWLRRRVDGADKIASPNGMDANSPTDGSTDCYIKIGRKIKACNWCIVPPENMTAAQDLIAVRRLAKDSLHVAVGQCDSHIGVINNPNATCAIFAASHHKTSVLTNCETSNRTAMTPGFTALKTPCICGVNLQCIVPITTADYKRRGFCIQSIFR
jgi:hypothetical protein